MRFWAIEARPGELLVDEVVVTEAVSRILGITTVEALFLFTSRTALDGFMEGFLPDDAEGQAGPDQRKQAEDDGKDAAQGYDPPVTHKRCYHDGAPLPHFATMHTFHCRRSFVS